MSAIMGVLRAMVREELAARRECELGIVTQVFSSDGGDENSLELNVRLRGSAVELQRVPVVVARSGLSALPRVGDLVALLFVGGDLNAPLVVGVVHDEQTRPPDAGADELVYRIPDDAREAARRLEIALPGGNRVTLQDRKLTVVMGSTTVVVEQDGAVTVEAGGDMNLSAAGNLNIEASGMASLKGASVLIEAQSDAKLKGTTTTIAGITNFNAT